MRPVPNTMLPGMIDQAASFGAKAADLAGLADVAGTLGELAGAAAIVAAPIAILQAIMGPSLAQYKCEAGYPGFPGCAIPGGSAQALVDAGLPPAVAQQVVAEIVAAGKPVVGGGGPPGGGIRHVLN